MTRPETRMTKLETRMTNQIRISNARMKVGTARTPFHWVIRASVIDSSFEFRVSSFAGIDRRIVDIRAQPFQRDLELQVVFISPDFDGGPQAADLAGADVLTGPRGG